MHIAFCYDVTDISFDFFHYNLARWAVHQRREREGCMKHFRLTGTAALIACVFLFLAVPAGAYDQPAVNLGFTSFLDGGPPAGPGFYFTQYIQYYRAAQLNGADGKELPLPDPEIEAWVSLSQFIYQSNKPVLLGGKWGIDVIVPVVNLSADYGSRGPFPEDNGTGLGDILVGPFIQWDPVMGEKGPVFMHRIELQMLLPTGKYDSDKELNPGSNFFSFNPYWSGTLFITPKLTSSLRFHYLWNAENDDPNRGFSGADETQAGQAIHANFAVDYEVVTGRLRAGLNGYFFRQLHDTEVDGREVPGSRERVAAFGPGFVYHHSQNQHLFFNFYKEYIAKNRTEGEKYVVRYVHHF